ncbi:MAG: hypothetical protein JWM47_1759, partial [Acidimicrobiales bacterium]|nr:hypothetical protein [Acidimicrobiales bacterium]
AALSSDRSGWAVVSLSGSFDDLESGVALSALLFELIAEGNRIVSVDARWVSALGPTAGRGLVAAAELLQQTGGLLLLSGLRLQLRLVVQVFDEHGCVHLTRIRR